VFYGEKNWWRENRGFSHKGMSSENNPMIFFFFNGAAAHIGPWPPLYEVP
jgi:hypothetical protein